MTRDGYQDPPAFRWKSADAGEPALFGADELFLPDLGTGRMSDLEFLHVTAKRILNHVPSDSRAPTDWTINVYRGCSHACSYCLAGDTPVLLADGRTRPIAELRPGDHVYGTAHGRYVATEVLDQWRTTRRAFRVTLCDGAELTASADHRLRTDRGWRRVAELAGTTVLGLAPSHPLWSSSDDGNRPSEVRSRTEVGSVVDLGLDVPMYDITTGTGDFVANGVVSHNCFARPTHSYLGLDIGHDFDHKIVVKINAVEKLRAELADPRWRREPVAMGTNTDPYQRAEAKYRLTRGVLQALTDAGTPFSILTKSPLVVRDLDILTVAAKTLDVSVNFSLGTLDRRVWRATEPGAPDPRRRVDAMRTLSDAGIRTGALVAPVLPGISDRREQLREVVAAIDGAGGRLLGIGALHLRPGTREHFLDWLRDFDPELHRDYLRRYAASDYAPQRYLDELYRRAGVKARGRSGPASPPPARRTADPA